MSPRIFTVKFDNIRSFTSYYCQAFQTAAPVEISPNKNNGKVSDKTIRLWNITGTNPHTPTDPH